MKKREKRRIVQISAILISIIILVFFAYSIINYTELTEEYTEEFEQNYAILFLTTIFLEGFPQLISAALILTSMILAGFSPHGLILTVALGSFIGSLGGFYIGYLYSNDIADLVISQKNRQKHTKRIRHYIDRYGKIITAVIAITPVPYFPVVFGTIKLKPKDFIIYGAVVRSCSYVLYGYLVYFFQINLTQFL